MKLEQTLLTYKNLLVKNVVTKYLSESADNIL